MEVNMVDFLVCESAVVLKDVVVLSALGSGDLLGDREELGEGFVGNVGEFGAVVFGDYELRRG
jgi:hypothetical protein